MASLSQVPVNPLVLSELWVAPTINHQTQVPWTDIVMKQLETLRRRPSKRAVFQSHELDVERAEPSTPPTLTSTDLMLRERFRKTVWTL